MFGHLRKTECHRQNKRKRRLRVQSSKGAVSEFIYQRLTRIGDLGISGRLAGAAQDQVTAWLGSDVLERHPITIQRNIRQPSDQLPEPLALKALIEETYGAPSAPRSMAEKQPWPMLGAQVVCHRSGRPWSDHPRGNHGLRCESARVQFSFRRATNAR